jgi:hypothetical protein
METGTSYNPAGARVARDAGNAWGNGYALAAPAHLGSGKPHRGIGALATSMRDLVRDTVYVTFDALRGRYDR